MLCCAGSRNPAVQVVGILTFHCIYSTLCYAVQVVGILQSIVYTVYYVMLCR